MTSLQKWFAKPYAKVRIDPSIEWPAWTRMLRLPFRMRSSQPGPGIRVVDRISLGGKKALLLVCVADRRVLVGVGDTDAPVIVEMDMRPLAAVTGRGRIRRARASRGGRGQR